MCVCDRRVGRDRPGGSRATYELASVYPLNAVDRCFAPQSLGDMSKGVARLWTPIWTFQTARHRECAARLDPRQGSPVGVAWTSTLDRELSMAPGWGRRAQDTDVADGTRADFDVDPRSYLWKQKTK